MGRFINADKYTTTGQRLDGNNMFAYCLNNPIVYYDPNGEWTFSIGWGVSGTFFGGASYSVSFSFDSSWNFALQTTKADAFKANSEATFGLPSIGVVNTYSFTTVETVDDLCGPSINVGASAPICGPVSVGGDVALSPSDPSQIVGGGVSLGVGAGIDAHATISETQTEVKINIVDTIKTAWNKITDWFWGGK